MQTPEYPANVGQGASLCAERRGMRWNGSGALVRAIVIVVAANILIFGRTVNYEFTNWDDDAFIENNPFVTQRGAEWVFRSLTKPREGYYAPTLWLTWRLWRGLWGMKPGAFHLLNVAFHCGNAALLVLLINRLGVGAAWAALGALLWSVHPLRVESVAWVTELKDVESAFFALLSALFFLRAAGLTSASGERQANQRTTSNERPIGKSAHYVLSVCASALAMGAKGTLCVWPLGLFLLSLSAWRVREGKSAFSGCSGVKRTAARLAMLLAPHVLLGIFFGATMFRAQSSLGVVPQGWREAHVEQAARAAYAFVFHLRLHVWPAALSALYRWPEYYLGEKAWRLRYFPAVIATVFYMFLLAVALWKVLKTGSQAWWWAAFAMLFYLVIMLPMTQIVPTARPLADRYTYVSGMGFFAALSALGQYFESKARRPIIPIGAAACVAAVASGLAVQRLPVWRDSVSLWSDVVEKTPATAMAHSQLGMALMKKGRWAEAETQLARALEIEPGNILAHANMGVLMFERGEYDEAARHFAAAVEAEPRNFNARFGLVQTLLKGGRTSAAESQLEALLSLPDWQPGRYCRLALDFRERGRYAAAAACARRAVKDSPANAAYWNILGACLLDGGDAAGAAEAFRMACRLAPENPAFKANLQKAEGSKRPGQ